MEIFSWHDGLGKYVEVGNSGMFRPEMLLPMGLPENVIPTDNLEFFPLIFCVFSRFALLLGDSDWSDRR
jgi:hypothetical protein